MGGWGLFGGCTPTGGIPEELGNLSALEQMYFNHNHLSGKPLPEDHPGFMYALGVESTSF